MHMQRHGSSIPFNELALKDERHKDMNVNTIQFIGRKDKPKRKWEFENMQDTHKTK